MCIEVSTPYFQEEKTRNVVLNLSSPFQSLNSSGQPGPRCSRCSFFVRQNQVYSCIHGSCIISEDANDIFQAAGLSGNEKTIRNCLHTFKGSHGEPEDNAGSIKRVEDNNSRAPADGESAKKPPKRRQSGHQSSHYDEGTNGTAKAYKKRKQDSAEREDVDSDELAEGSGKAKNGRKRKDEEEEPGKKKFACPFYKYDRQAFMSSRTCVGPGWDSVHRVKEHIFRRHMLLSTQCEDCLTVFETLPALDEHLRNPCRKKPPQRSYGINKEQEKQLRSRRMYQKSLDEEEKWRAIYKIIFPGEKNIPSPYYEPEVPEFPDIYQQMLIKDLPEIVTRRLTAPESGLVEHITANAMANRHSSTREADRKPIGGLDLMGSTQVLVGKQLKQRIQDTVEAAVKEMLSRVDGQKEPSPELKINVESPDEDLSTWMKTEEYVQPARPTRPQSNLLQLPVIGGTDTKLDPRAQYPTPTSSAFDRSPEVPLAAMAEPSFLQPVLQGENFHPLFNENHPGNELEGMTGGGSFPELENLISSNWENLSSTGSIPAVPMYTSAGPSLSLNVSGPTSASLQNHEFLSAQETEQESFALGPWEFSPAPAIHSVDSGYETIPCPSTSNAFGEWDVDDHFKEPYIYDER
ncbi:hypothetical protein CDV31_014545 [Fusarium ambrosium]|uniref:C2H2-type domain-containing protein n=1 Tax=Fusarium ambrosium TaxID=131363 RepID=A0A428SVP3_9HYPO|nr:hypothetical protein CDV31_014545 [Fusarium ambrosium]